jgi:phage terminase large subunit
LIHTDTKVIKTTLYSLENKTPLLIQQGGTNSGKTYGIITALILYCAKQTEYKLVTVVAVNFPYIRRDTLRCFNEIIIELGIPILNKSKTTSTYQIGHCFIEFIGMEDPGKASHGKRDILYINEAYLIPYMVYKNLSIRTDQTTILDYNPHEDFWLQTTVVPTLESDKYQFVRTTYLNNPAVSDKVIREIESLKDENINLYNVLALGRTGKLEGLVFPNVRLVDKFPIDCKRIGYGMDFGYSNDPTAIVKMGLYQGEIYLEEICYDTGMLNEDIVNKLYESQVTEYDIIVADSADPKSIAEINKKGFKIKGCVKGNDSISFGIDLINQYKINIIKTSVNLIKEQKNYRYIIDKEGKKTNKPIDKYNHIFDATRYVSTELLTPKTIFKRRVKVF